MNTHRASSHNQLLGYFELSLAMFFLALSIVVSKFLIDFFTVFFLMGVRFIISLCIFLLIPISRNSLFLNTTPLHLREWLLLFGQGISSALFNIFILYGIQKSTAVTAGLLTSTTPVFTSLFAFILLRESFGFLKIIAVILAIISVAILNTHGNILLFQWDFSGNTFLLMAVACGSLFAIFTKLLPPSINPLKMTVVCNFFVLIVCMPFFIHELNHLNLSGINPSTWILIILYAITGSILFPLFWNKGQYKTSAAIASLFTGIMPVTTAILSALFLEEQIYITDVWGTFFLLVSIFMGTREVAVNDRKFNFSTLLGKH